RRRRRRRRRRKEEEGGGGPRWPGQDPGAGARPLVGGRGGMHPPLEGQRGRGTKEKGGRREEEGRGLEKLGGGMRQRGAEPGPDAASKHTGARPLNGLPPRQRVH
ncbi:unnamed protein product, partial [Prorocentrum cordatum]